MAEETFREITGIKVNYHYARNIYLKVFFKNSCSVDGGSSTTKLFNPQFYFLGFFLYTENTHFQENQRGFAIQFFFLDCNLSNKNLVYSLLLQKIRLPVLVFYKLELEVSLIILDVSLKFSQSFQNIEAAFKKCSTKLVVQQNDVMKYSSSAPMVKTRKVFLANLLKIELHRWYFLKNFTTSSKY